MSKAEQPSILLLYPSCFYYPEWMERLEIKTSQLLLASFLAQYYPVEYADFEITIGRPNSAIQIKRYERLVREFLSKRDFDILAISCWTSLSYQATLKTARICRELYPDKLIVVGGYHPSARPSEFLTEDKLIDYVISGEGELALKEIANNFRHGDRPQETTFIKAPMFPQDQFVPHNWGLVDQFIADNCPNGITSMYVYASRGCPFGCSFCMESLKDRRWRAFTPEESVHEVAAAVDRFKAYSIAVCDACFGMRPLWRKEFLRKLVESQPDFWIVMETRPEYLDEEDIKLLSQLKVEIQLGIESCSPEMLLLMRKTKQPDKYLQKFSEVSHLMSQYGVLHRANLILNHPGETRKTLDETFTYVDSELRHRDSTLIWACHNYMNFPGCEIDLNRSYYEKTFGSTFATDWWKDESDQYAASQLNSPSSDLSGYRVNLWQQMLADRMDAMKQTLSQAAFKFAARKYFFDWTNDPRYQQV